jgi:hypothetical protein
MKNKILSLLIIILLISMANESIAQRGQKRSFFGWALKGDFRPFVEALYGIGEPKHNTFTNTFSKFGHVEARVGYSEIKKYRKAIWELDERFIFGNYLSSDADFLDDKSGNIKSEAYRFGFGSRLGYGYMLGPITLIPYHQNQFIWTKLMTTRPEDISEEDNDILDRYEGTYRFGVSTEGGAKLELFKSISVVASYELGVVYPRHIFWPWLGSYVIMQTGLGMVSVFAEDIVKSSQVFGPIMYFLLKNGISYAFYKGLQDRMNWPFDSETPLTMETFKLGVSIKF